MTLASVDGTAVARACVSVPAWGVWYADVDLVEPEEIAAGTRVSFVLGDVTLSGTIASGGAIHGRAAYRIVGGAGGWSTELARKAYTNDAGVKVSLVLEDAARGAGETIAGAPSTRLGTHYVRAEGPARLSLNDLAPRGWYVDFEGVTQIGTRAATEYAGDAPRTRVDLNAGIIELATDEIASLVPGVVVDDLAAASDVEYVLDEKRLTVRVYAGRASDARRLHAAFERMLNEIDPRREYRAAYEYRVISQSGERLNLQPVRVASGMPDLLRVPVRLAPGIRATHAIGSRVLVAFADADPSRPFVFAGDAPGAPGWMPLFLDLGEEPRLGVARQTDTVVAGPFGGTITLASARIRAGL